MTCTAYAPQTLQHILLTACLILQWLRLLLVHTYSQHKSCPIIYHSSTHTCCKQIMVVPSVGMLLGACDRGCSAISMAIAGLRMQGATALLGCLHRGIDQPSMGAEHAKLSQTLVPLLCSCSFMSVRSCLKPST